MEVDSTCHVLHMSCPNKRRLLTYFNFIKLFRNETFCYFSNSTFVIHDPISSVNFCLGLQLLAYIKALSTFWLFCNWWTIYSTASTFFRLLYLSKIFKIRFTTINMFRPCFLTPSHHAAHYSKIIRQIKNAQTCGIWTRVHITRVTYMTRHIQHRTSYRNIKH